MHHVEALGGGDEGAGRHQAPVGPAQAQQHLVALAGGRAPQRHHRLEVQHEAVAGERLAQARGPAEVGAHGLALLGAGAVHAHAVAPAALGQVAGDVGIRHGLAGRGRGGIEQHRADARVDAEGASPVEEGEVGEQAAEGLGRLGHAAGVDIVQEHRELVAADAREQVRPAQARAELAPHLAQQRVARRVPRHVVDVLEAVEVDVEQRAALARAAQALELARQRLLEVAAVGQLRDGVVRGLPAQLLLEALALADVAEGQHRALAAAADGERVDGALDLHGAAVAPAQHRLPAAQVLAAPAGGQQPLARPAGVALGVHEGLDRGADQAAVAGRAPEDGAGGGVEEGDAPLAADPAHPLADGVQDALEALALALDRPVGAHRARHRGEPRQEQLVGLVLEHALDGAGVEGIADDLVEIGAGEDGRPYVGGARVLAQAPAQHVAVLARHEVVDHGDLERALARERQRLLRGGGEGGLVAVALEQAPVLGAHGRRVVDEKDAHRRLGRGRRRGRRGLEELGERRRQLAVVVPEDERGMGPRRGPAPRRGMALVREDDRRRLAPLGGLQVLDQGVGAGLAVGRPAEHHGVPRRPRAGPARAERGQGVGEGGHRRHGMTLAVQELDQRVAQRGRAFDDEQVAQASSPHPRRRDRRSPMSGYRPARAGL